MSTRVLSSAVVLLVWATALQAQPGRLRPRDVDSLPSGPPTERISYGSDSLQFGDLRLPEGAGPFPLVILIHGGCWAHRYSLQNSTAMADALRDAGVATWNVEYRRYDSPGGGWPGTMRDIGDAVDYVRTIAGRYPIDLTRVVVAGHSAGGHLALWAAGRKRLPSGSAIAARNPLPLRGAVAIGGPGDLKDFVTYGGPICGEGTIDKLLGGKADAVPDHWSQASPAELLPLGVRQRLIVGDGDGVMPERARAAYIKLAQDKGDRVDAVIVPDAGHFEVIAPTTKAWPLVRDAIMELLRK